jgi:hypothetical protein
MRMTHAGEIGIKEKSLTDNDIKFMIEYSFER